MTHDEKSTSAQRVEPGQASYIQYKIRLRKGSLAEQGLQRQAQRFNSRYEAGWLATLIEEFYVLLDGPDPRSSLLYPLLYHRFEALKAVSMPAPLPQEGSEAVPPHERDDGIDLTEVQDMSKNLQGYFDEDS